MQEIIGRIPPWMIHQSFRYVIGRRTYAVSQWVDWACANWDAIPPSERDVIVRELEEAFGRDDKLRGRGDWEYALPLGDDCDREQWEKLRDRYKTGEI